MNRTCGWPSRLPALLLASLATPALLCASTVLDLTLGGTKTVSNNSTASYINDNGEVTGYSYISGSTSIFHTYLYDPLGSPLITDIDAGTSLSGLQSSPTGLNASGEISGTAGINAFLYGSGLNSGAPINLATLDGVTFSYGSAINAGGDVVGAAMNPSTGLQAYNFSNSQYLGTLGGVTSQAEFIDTAGQIVGKSDLSGQGTDEAFFYQFGSPMTAITLGGTTSQANAMNATGGDVVGDSTTTSGFTQAFLYTPAISGSPGTPAATIDLGAAWACPTPPCATPTNSDALALNDSGEIVGQADVSTGVHHAVTFTLVGGNYVMTDLGTTEGLPDSTAVAVNDNGWVVGYSSNAGGTGQDPFLYIPPSSDNPLGEMIDLKFEVGSSDFQQLTTVTGINASGLIIGEGVTTSGLNDGFLLSYSAATPEPSTTTSMLLGLTLCAAGFWRARRKRG